MEFSTFIWFLLGLFLFMNLPPPKEVKEINAKNDLIKKYDKDMVESAIKKQLKIGMPTELVEKYYGKADAVRNTLENVDGKFTEWYYKPLQKITGEPELDSAGKPMYGERLKIKDGKIIEIYRP